MKRRPCKGEIISRGRGRRGEGERRKREGKKEKKKKFKEEEKRKLIFIVGRGKIGEEKEEKKTLL